MIFFKKICFLLVLVLFSNVQAQTEETILWKPGVKLTWSNFKENAPVSNRVAAITASGINYKYTTSFKNNSASFTFEIGAFFYPNKSWYKKDLCTDITLSHEQLHFDIAELFARKMRLKLSAIKPSSNTKKEVKDIYTKINKDLEAYQDLYDKETNYSRDIEKQFYWNNKVAADLLKKK
ncbi:DUF922 domain-containing protein [Cellulophaga sp. 20_2_10]|uniref:DUF922 domain-containing protein n=1 Tax=Cellulophaga sp. 20_2_10 TaxID=2942476 RepID=UPI00201AA155|nr:DUF922 domain-containing protein [Cellulophaga sp. 20_2_10]MCL5245979.1 DUF922 domain-containing protein [Cellulophaga sp. 20_2_10]